MQHLDDTEQRFDLSCMGSVVVGALRVPSGAAPRAGLVFDGPLTSVKEQATGNYGKALAARGFVTLAFDHRHFARVS